VKKLRIYLDTSVFGGCFDEEFTAESKQLFTEIMSGCFEVVVSRTTLDELNRAPERVQKILADIPEEFVELFDAGDEADKLATAYLEAGILGKSSMGDAEHIAAASLAEVDFVVSWNFKHIVHYDKIRAYQAVNMLKGYKPILIYSPKEVVEYDSED
jgi:predicted nucleic acid-binding protein